LVSPEGRSPEGLTNRFGFMVQWRIEEKMEVTMKQEAEARVRTVSAKEQKARKTVREIRRATRRKFSVEEKVRIVLEGLRGEQTVSELCRREGIAPTVYYKWSKSFLEAGKQRLVGETKRNASTEEVRRLRGENAELKRLVAEQMLKIELFKKSLGC
jgi:transposase